MHFSLFHLTLLPSYSTLANVNRDFVRTFLPRRYFRKFVIVCSFPNSYSENVYIFEFLRDVPRASVRLPPASLEGYSLIPRATIHIRHMQTSLFSTNPHFHAPALLITSSNSALPTPLPTPAPPFASKIMSLSN
ncbi:hypothetical protein F5Y11DRAFT_312078 [Daldinia sp. FL1419]|nr:hypothetical protein F5Y11DRAFT_312078 [Daldinia sp. FL1419]